VGPQLKVPILWGFFCVPIAKFTLKILQYGIPYKNLENFYRDKKSPRENQRAVPHFLIISR